MGYGRKLFVILLVLTLILSLTPSTPVIADDSLDEVKQKFHPVFYEKISELKDSDVVVAVVRLKPLPPEIARTVSGNYKLAVDTLKKWSHITQASILKEIHELKGVILNRFWIDNVLIVRIPVGGLKKLAENPLVVRIFENFEVKILDAGKPVRTVDPLQSVESWGIYKIDAPGAWSMGYTGEGIRIAILDTGVDITHPALEGKMFTIDPNDPHYPGGWMEFDDYGNPVLSEPHDTHGHGTHVSGTALGGDTEDILIGVAPSANLMHGLVLPGGSGTFASVLAGIQWAVDPFYIDPDTGQLIYTGKPAHVISMSLGASGYYGNELLPGIEAALMANIIVVAAIGNGGPGTSSNPGNIWGVFGVGATDQYDQVAYFSSGEEVNWPSPPSEWPFNDTYPSTYIKPDFSAPGVDIVSSVPGGGYEAWSGTSMATPHVAGTVALVLQAAGWTDFTTPDTPEKVYYILKATALDLGDPGQDIRYGWGRIDAREAVALAQQFAKKSGVEGYVYDIVDHTPIPWATVTVVELNKTVEVSSEGYFRIPLDPGNYTLLFEAWGYQDKTVVVEVIALNGTIAGYVYDAISGLPIEGALVSIPELNLTTYTDANGTFSLSVPPGTYTLEASATGYQPFSTSVTVDENETVVVPIPLTPLGTGTIYGWVFDAETLEPIPNATVVLDYGETTTTDASGYYEFPEVVAGSHTVFVFKPGYISANATVFVPPDGAVELNFTLQPVPPSVVVLGNVEYYSEPHIAELISSLGYPVVEYDDVDDLLDDWVFGNVNPRVVVADHFKADADDLPSWEELYAFLQLSLAYNTSVIFLGTSYAGYTAIHILQEYHDELISNGFPAVTSREYGWPSADKVLVVMLNPNSTLFTNVTPDFDNMFYLADLDQSDYADYLIVEFDPEVPVNIVGLVNDTENGRVGVGVAYWYSPSGAPWFYLSSWGESYWMGYIEPGSDGLYSINTAQVLLNAVWLGYERNVSIESLAIKPSMVPVLENLGSGSEYEPELYTYLEVYMERQPYGYVEGRIIGSDDVVVTWAEVTVLGTPITLSVDENGSFRTWLPAGEYTLVVTADGYAPLTINVTVNVNETTDVGLLVLKHVPRIAILYDYLGEIKKFIEDNFNWYAKDYNNITQMTIDIATGFYDVVIHAGYYYAPMPSEEEFLTMLNTANSLGLGIMFLDQWSHPNYPDIFGYGIRALHEYLGDPSRRFVGDVYDTVSLVITEEHPVFWGYEVGQIVELMYNPGAWGTDYAYFKGFSGETIGQLFFEGQIQGDAIAWKITETGSKWLLMASFAPEEYQDMQYWTQDALIIFGNAIKWIAMKPVNVTLANPYLHVGDEALVNISGAPANTTFHILFKGEIIGNVTTDANGTAVFSFIVPLVPGGKYLVEAISEDEQYYGSAELYVMPKLVVTPTSLTVPGIVDVEATGLKPYEKVMLYIDGNILSIIRASELGTFQISLNIWLVATGKHTLRLVAENGEELYCVELTIVSRLDDLEVKLDDIAGLITDLQDDIATIQTKTGEIEARLSELNATLVGLIVSKTGELYALINTSIGNILVNLDNLGATLDEALGRLETLGVRVDDITTKIDALSNKTGEIEAKMDDYYNNVMDKLDEILSTIQSSTQQLQEQVSNNFTSMSREVSEAKNTASTATYVGGGAVVLALLALALAFFKKT